MSIIKIELEKPVQEFEIGGKVYEVGYDDDSLRNYEKIAKDFYEKAHIEVNVKKMTKKELRELENKQYQALKETIEGFFGKGSYDEIYSAAGKSLINISKVVSALLDWLHGKLGEINDQAKAYYTK